MGETKPDNRASVDRVVIRYCAYCGRVSDRGMIQKCRRCTTAGMHVVFRGSIPEATKRTVSRIVRDLSNGTEIRHRIKVVAVEGHKLRFRDGKIAFAVFHCPESGESGPLTIYLACLRQPGMTKRNWYGYLAGLVAHELAHYEQFRDGLKMQERGVAARAKRILRDSGYRVEV